MRLAIVVAAAIVLGACGSRSSETKGQDTANSRNPVRQYIRLAVALGERDNQSLDYYYGPENWVSDVKKQPPGFAAIAHEAEQLFADLNGPQEEFLRKQVRAVAARARMLTGKRFTFDEEAAVLFDLASLPQVDDSKLEETRRQIAKLLPGNGSLAARYDAFEARFLIPPERIPAVMDAAVKECRARSLARLNLPAEETITTAWVQDKPWSAFSLYQGGYRSRVRWNADFALTPDRALQLACHETYPGHHVQSMLLDRELVQKHGRVELMVQPTFSPQSFLSEALASAAVDLAFTPAEREKFQQEVLFPLAGLKTIDAKKVFQIDRLVEGMEISQVGIARDFLDGRLEFVRAAEQFERQALMSHADATLKYLNQYRSYMLGYTTGRAMARSCLINSNDRWVVFQQVLLGETTLDACAGANTPIRQIE